jgi:O-antigen/teichoic acid export membrane protein
MEDTAAPRGRPEGPDDDAPRSPMAMIRRRLQNAVVRGSLWGLVLTGLGTAIAFGASVVLARLIEMESFGRYLYVQTWLNAVAVFARLGLDTTAMRYVGGYNARQEWGLLRGFLRWAWRTGTFASLAVATLIAGAVFALGDRIQPELANLFYQLALVLPFYTRLQISNSALLSMKWVVSARGPMQVGRPLLMVGVIAVIVLVFRQEMTASGAMWITNGSYVVLLGVNGLLLARALPGAYREAKPEERAPDWMKTTIPLLLLGAITLLNNSIDTLLLPFVGATGQDLALYGNATRVVRLVAFGLQAVNAIFPAVVAELYAKGKLAELQRQASVSAGLLVAFTVPLALGLLIFGKFILGLSGPGYVAAYPILAVLSIGQIVNAATGSVGFILALTGNERLSLRILVGSLILNATLVVGLYPFFGLLGAAIGNTVAISAWNISMVFAVRKKIGIHPTVLSLIWKPKRAANRPAD